MKSPMIMMSDYIKDKDLYSDLKVMQSGAGYYVGTSYADPDMGGFEVPGSRDSYDYYESRADAEAFLARVEHLDNWELAASMLRLNP